MSDIERDKAAVLGGKMRFGLICIAFVATLTAFQIQHSSAAEIRVLSIPFKAPLEELGPQFERISGHKLIIKYAPSAPLRQLIDNGEPFDVVVIFPNLVDELVKEGKVAAGSRTDIARAGLGVAVKKGATKPDVTSTNTFKQALLSAKSIAYAAQGPSGIYFVTLLERLGIGGEMKPKLKPMGAGSLVLGPVAKGEAELGVVSIPFILAEPGVELAGTLPSDLQDYVYYSAGVGAAAQDAKIAKSFINFLMEPRSNSVMRSHGLERTLQ
jgi:molybdate transport system substrate-binding protein